MEGKQRILCLHTLECEAHLTAGVGRPAADVFELGTMREHYRRGQAELPWLLGEYSAAAVTFAGQHDLALDQAQLSLYAVPDSGLVSVLSFDHAGDVPATVDVLQALTFRKAELRYGGRTLLETVDGAAAGVGATGLDFGMDTFHIVVPADANHPLFSANAASPLPDRWPQTVNLDVATRLIYKTHAPTRSQFTTLALPPTANRQESMVVAVELPGAIVFGFGDWFVNAATTSSILALSALSRLRQIRRTTYVELHELELLPKDVAGMTRLDLARQRAILGSHSQRLSDFDLAIASGIESRLEVATVLPSPTLAAYHRALVDALHLPEGVRTTSTLVDRLRASLSARREAVEAGVRAYDDLRRAHVSIAAGVFSTVVVGLSVFFGFFGANAREVSPDQSFFDHRYLAFYVLMLSIAVIPASLFAALAFLRRSGVIGPAELTDWPPKSRRIYALRKRRLH